MALTAQTTGTVTLTAQAWDRIANGAGFVTISTDDYDVFFAITAADTDPVAPASGHPLERGKSLSMELQAGEHLSLRGPTGRKVEVTADNPLI